MREIIRRLGAGLKSVFESIWHYLGSLAAVCLFAAVLGLGIFHAVVQDAPLRFLCYAGVYNPAGAEPPRGISAMGVNAEPGVPHVRLEYSADGVLQRMRSVDEAGRLAALPGSQVAEQRLYYNKQARLVRKENRGVSGALAADAQGVAVREFGYDASGQLNHMLFRDATGKLTVPRYPGFAECRISHDTHGRPLLIEYLGSEGEPLVNAEGEQRVVYEYDDAARSSTRSNYIAGQLAENRQGVARECEHMQPGGTCRRWQNAAGEPVSNAAVGAAELRLESGAAPGVVRRLFLNCQGEPCAGNRACAEHLVRLNRAGLPEWECYGGADGMPVNNPARGYAERVCDYSDSGVLEREYFWDAAGNPAPVCERRHTSTPAGRYSLSLHADGASAVQPE